MQDLQVRLTKTSMKDLQEAASTLGMTPEQAFEYVVRNTLPSYPNLAEGGHYRYFQDGECVTWLRLGERDIIDKVITKLRAKGPGGSSEAKLFEASIRADTKEEVKSVAKRFKMSVTDLYNHLVQVGCDPAIHLQGGTVYAFNKTNQNLGMIKFTP